MKVFLLTLTVCASNFAVGAQSAADDWRTQAPVSLKSSLNARFHPVPVSAVEMSDGFWGVRLHWIAERVLPVLRQQLEDKGTIDNFIRIAGKKNVPRKGRPGSDADLYKWMEAAAWATVSLSPSSPVKQKFLSDLESLIQIVAGAQDPSGYLDTFYSAEKANLRFTDLLHSDEDHCLAHLLIAGIAYYRVTGNRDLLSVGIRFADHVISNYGPNGKPFVAVHPELESALVELYRTLGETKYLDFARYLLSGGDRERLRLRDSDIRYLFSAKPFVSRTELDGQAVGALQTASGATDYVAESGDPAYRHVLDLLWQDLTQRKMSLVGGAALRINSEVFGEAYDVADGSFNSETAVAVANAAWNYRLLAVTADARYSDLFERALYNGIGASLSINSTITCYRSLSTIGIEKGRSPYYESSTCPPDLLGFLESLPSYVYSTSRDGVFVNLFNDSELNWHLEDGTGLRIVQSTNYPWDGEVKLRLYPAKPSQFALRLRWPEWAANAEFTINGSRVTGDFNRGSFVALTRTWQAGDVVELVLPISLEVIRANPRADDLYGKAAIERGPLVYSIQQPDNPAAPISDTFIRPTGTGTTEFHKELLGGITVVRFPGFVSEKLLSIQPLYEPWNSGVAASRKPVSLTLVPYFTCGSRAPENVEIWIPVFRGTEPPLTGMMRYFGEKR